MGRGDEPRTLGDPAERARRHGLLQTPRVATLTAFVQSLRDETRKGNEIPFFDPLDGGVEARVLFLLEAPGPQAVSSGFVSRNNPDASAANFFEACAAAGLPRELTVAWNIVPWYIGAGGTIRPATREDIAQGLPYLARLLALLPRLEIVVLVGKKAQAAEPWLRRNHPALRLMHSPHPSPMFVNRKPENRARLHDAFRSVAEALGSLQAGSARE